MDEKGPFVQTATTPPSEVETPKWFSETIAKQSDNTIIRTLEAVKSGSKAFRERLQGYAKRYQHGNLPVTKAELDAQIASYSSEDLGILASDAVQGALKRRGTWDRKRQAGTKRFGKGAQKFLTSFSGFLNVYSGIIELVRGAGLVYGNVAYETLSIFLIVVVNKSDNDGKMAELVIGLEESLPHLDTWASIYPTAKMEKLVTEVYKQVIDLARDASTYFTKFSTRLWMAIGRPPSMGIDETTNQIYKKLAAVSSEAMVELHKSNHELHHTIGGLHQKIGELKQTICDMKDTIQQVDVKHDAGQERMKLERNNTDNQQLERMKETLKCQRAMPATDPATCISTLKAALHTKPLKGKHRYEIMTAEFLRDHHTWKSWHKPSETKHHQNSSMLVFGGTTSVGARASRGTTHSWLSPAAIHAVEEIRKFNGRAAFYCCHPTFGVEEDNSHYGKSVLAALTYQILEWDPSVLRRRQVQIEQHTRLTEWQTNYKLNKSKDNILKTKKEKITILQAWFRPLKEVLYEVKDSGVVHLVLDRVELIGDCTLNLFMKGLVDLVEDKGCLVKVLVIIDPTKQGLWDASDVEEHENIIVAQDMDQTR